MNKRHTLLVIVMIGLWLSCPNVPFAEDIFLDNGNKIEGHLVEETDEYYKVDSHGVILTYYKDYDLDEEYPSLNEEEVNLLKTDSHYYQHLINWMKDNKSIQTRMPFSFSVLKNEERRVLGRMGKSESVTGIIERMIVKEGFSVYDVAVYQIVLSLLGGEDNLRKAFGPLGVYWQGSLGQFFNIRAGAEPAQIFIYHPDKPQAVTSDLSKKGYRGFVFRILNAHGKYDTADPLDGKTKFDDFPNWPTVHWEDWKPIAGENAWIVLASLQLYHKKYYDPVQKIYNNSDAVELKLAEELARAAMLLQADDGGVRMAPLGTFCNLIGMNHELPLDEIEKQLNQFAHSVKNAAGSKDKSASDYQSPLLRWYYDEISTENNLSWQAAFRILYQVTKKEMYQEAQQKTLNYIKSVWNEEEGIFYQGAHWDQEKWIPNTGYFASDVQNWAIMSLGPALIDKWFGEGASYKLWNKTKTYSGDWNDSGQLIGVGFTKETDRICIEWTAGAIMGTRMLSDYYAESHADWAKNSQSDSDQMREGVENYRYQVSEDKAAYSYSSKRGWIPFGWFSHDPEVLSLVSTAWVILIDADFNPFYLP